MAKAAAPKVAAPAATPTPASSPTPSAPAASASPPSGAPPSPVVDAAVGSPSETPPSGPPSGEPSGAPIDADTFGWDTWDDSSFDAFPEPVRPWAQKLHGRFSAKTEEEVKKLNALREIYDSIISENTDPRLTTAQQEVEKLKKWQEGAAKNFGDVLAELRSKEEAMEKFHLQQAEQEAAAFRAKHSWIFDDGSMQHTAMELLNEDFEAEQLPELLRLPSPTLAKAREYHKSFVADGVKNAGVHALALAKAESQPPPPSKGADLISSPNTGPTTQGKPPSDASLKERENAAVQRAMRAHPRR